MPFNQVSILNQESQQAVVEAVCENMLTVKITGMDAAGDKAVRYEYVSRPVGLRKVDLSEDWIMVNVNKRSGVKGDVSGKVESLNPPYELGENVLITKKLKDPLDVSDYEDSCGGTASKPSFEDGADTTNWNLTNYRSSGKNKFTASFMIDENKAGRSWGSSGSGSGKGIPDGYEPKCVAFCENGTTVSGTILFNATGCEPVSSTGPEGTGPDGTGPDGTGPGGTGPYGTGPDGTGPEGGGGGAGTGPGGIGPAIIGGPPDSPAGTIDFIPL